MAWGDFPHEINLRWGQDVGLVDEAAERALQRQGFGGEGAGGFDGAGVFVAPCVDSGGGHRSFTCYVQGVICLNRVQGCIRLRHWPEG
jgi:hypothetical protein